VAPTVAYKITQTQSIGLAPLIGYQRFKASGLSAFAPLSQDATALTDRGYDSAFGIGVRIGYLWNITPEFSVGAAYSSPVFMQGFDKYKGLFAEDGSFDTPQSFSAGLGWQVSPALHAGIDYKWIDYAGIAAVGNSSSSSGQLGQAAGPGFGWRSISVIKLGGDWKVNDELTLRSGYSYNENPVTSSNVTFNILAPGVIKHHITAGATYAFGRQELSASYVHGVSNSVSGESHFVALGQAPPGTRETISMHQNSLGLQYSFKY
jgi:long-chain fatty acid transport protein